jgi:hypothetical protein
MLSYHLLALPCCRYQEEFPTKIVYVLFIFPIWATRKAHRSLISTICLFTPNTIPMSVTLDWTSAPFVRWGKHWNKVLTVATLVVRNAKEVMGAPMVESGPGGVFIGRECGVRWSVLCWYMWQESGFSRREYVFTFEKFYKFYTFNAIFTDMLQ